MWDLFQAYELHLAGWQFQVNHFFNLHLNLSESTSSSSLGTISTKSNIYMFVYQICIEMVVFHIFKCLYFKYLTICISTKSNSSMFVFQKGALASVHSALGPCKEEGSSHLEGEVLFHFLVLAGHFFKYISTFYRTQIHLGSDIWVQAYVKHKPLCRLN